MPGAVLAGLIWLAQFEPRKPLSTGPLALIAVIARDAVPVLLQTLRYVSFAKGPPGPLSLSVINARTNI